MGTENRSPVDGVSAEGFDSGELPEAFVLRSTTRIEKDAAAWRVTRPSRPDRKGPEAIPGQNDEAAGLPENGGDEATARDGSIDRAKTRRAKGDDGAHARRSVPQEPDHEDTSTPLDALDELDETAGRRLDAHAVKGKRLLAHDAVDYDFFQAVRQLERRFPKSPRLGGRGPASKERIRLRPSTSLAFQTSEVSSAGWVREGRTGPHRAELVSNFLGLYGTGTPLPITYAQEVLWEEEDQPQMRGFLDLFHHRLLSLLYRSWLRYRHEYAFEKGGKDRLSRALFDLIGISPDMTADQLGLDPVRLLRYIGLFLLPTRPTAGLEALLSEELETTVRIQPLTERWIPLPEDQVFRMNRDQRAQGFLGQDIVIGNAVLDRSGHIVIEIGPVSYERMNRFRPGQPEWKRVVAMSRLYVRQPLDLVMRVLVPASDIPSLKLGDPVQVGMTAFMGTPAEDPMAVTFEASIADGRATDFTGGAAR